MKITKSKLKEIIKESLNEAGFDFDDPRSFYREKESHLTSALFELEDGLDKIASAVEELGSAGELDSESPAGEDPDLLQILDFIIKLESELSTARSQLEHYIDAVKAMTAM